MCEPADGMELCVVSDSRYVPAMHSSSVYVCMFVCLFLLYIKKAKMCVQAALFFCCSVSLGCVNRQLFAKRFTISTSSGDSMSVL